ncbi:thiol methyltransferase like protein [Zymoseptoria brevis]|uniref:Thiol methyltransferase like protein n=1 Tax=Zymoseptoria brevis TaxID=1047168 RepID=A0A0F4GA71_9PEZI|nr:thiol methyltransferase like protein [Zymoseptoria brevis]
MSASASADLHSSDRQILRETFANTDPSTHTSHWESLWSQSLTPWDRSGPSMALKDAILSKSSIFRPSPSSMDPSTTCRKRALVPGCGRGYDVLLLASLGYDTWGLDASPTAIAAAESLKSSLLASSPPDPAYAAPPPPPSEVNITPGTATFLEADFFQTSLPFPKNGDDDDIDDGKEETSFDLIFDYTFLCALPPSLRPSWSARLHSLLTPETGRLVCLEWPLHKAPSEGGPPHGLTGELYEELLGKPGGEVEYDGEGWVVGGSNGGDGKGVEGGGFERVERWMPERTHEAGKGKDFVSVWRRV